MAKEWGIIIFLPDNPTLNTNFKWQAVKAALTLTLPGLSGPSRPAVNFRCLYPKNEKCWDTQT